MIFIEGECKLLNTRVNVRRTTQRNSHLPASDTTHRSMWGGGVSLQPLLMSFKCCDNTTPTRPPPRSPRLDVLYSDQTHRDEYFCSVYRVQTAY